MAVNCGFSVGVCRVRLTKVDSAGNVVAGNYSYVTDQIVSIAVAPNKETGNTFTARNACGCAPARFKNPDTLNWYDLTLTTLQLEPAMEALMFGTDAITDGGDTVGFAFPSTLACDEDEPAVALEWWSKHVVGSGQDGALPWWHGVIPMSVWTPGDETFEEGFLQPVATGFSRTNTQWGDGPYGDGPPDSQDIKDGGLWLTDIDPPDADCATQSVTATS